MKKLFLTIIMIFAGLGSASAMNVVGSVHCTTSDRSRVWLTVRGTVNPEHMGMPGLLYLAIGKITPNSIKDAHFVSGNGFVEYNKGGPFPITRIVREGLGSFSFRVDISQFASDENSAWFGYGVLTPEMETFVTAAREAITNAKATGANIPDAGDDWRRRNFIENDMRKQGRYVPVVKHLGCYK